MRFKLLAINTKMCSLTRIFKNFNHCFTVSKFEKREKLTTIGGRFMKQTADPLPIALSTHHVQFALFVELNFLTDFNKAENLQNFLYQDLLKISRVSD